MIPRALHVLPIILAFLINIPDKANVYATTLRIHKFFCVPVTYFPRHIIRVIVLGYENKFHSHKNDINFRNSIFNIT